MQKFLPIENIVYRTKLTEEQVVTKLAESIEAEKSFGFGAYRTTYSKPYIGTIRGNSFEIKRVINYQNSFLPTISGKIQKDGIWTKIYVTMKPEIIVITFMAIWFGCVGLGCIGAIYYAITTADEFSPFFLIPFAMLLFGVILLFGAPKIESSKSKKDLQNILEAEIIE